MNIPVSMLMMAAGLWLALLLGCLIFIFVGFQHKRRADAAAKNIVGLQEQIKQLVQKQSGGSAADGLNQSDEQEHVGVLKQKIDELEKHIADFEGLQAGSENDPNRVSKLRLDKLNEKYQNLQTLVESGNKELLNAETQIAELQGANAALQAERDMLERQMQSFSESVEVSDADTMREMIVNFTEESRELLMTIEELSKEKAELYQKIADMESGGKGTAGTVVGLKRKLAEAEAEIVTLKSGGTV